MKDQDPPRSDGARVIDLHARPLDRAKTAEVQGRAPRCTKCASTFVEHEPAFVHCKYCGNMMRVAGAVLLEQDTYELRSGLRSIDAVSAGLYG